MDKTFYLLIACVLICMGCTHSTSSRRQNVHTWREDNGKLKVLATTGMIQDLVQIIGGEYVDSLALIQGELDPHTYQLVKGDDEKLQFADIIFYNGLGLEHGPSLQRHLVHHARAVGLGDEIARLYPASILWINGQQDPHIWMDIDLWSKGIPLIAETLSRSDPAHKDYFWKNSASLLENMLFLHEEIRTSLQQLPSAKRYLVTSHDAFNYFARAYLADEGEEQGEGWKKRVAAPEGLAPESQLSATDIRRLADYIQEHDVKVLFSETNVSLDSLRKIVQVAGGAMLPIRIASQPLYGDAMGEPHSDGDTYLKMIQHNARVFKDEVLKQAQE
jgi:manganese/zinc/iron transport system substrate-binding protein